MFFGKKVILIKQSYQIDPKIQKQLEKGLAEHNQKFAGDPKHQMLQLTISDDQGLAAGLTGESLNRMFKIKLLWVREDQRSKGLAGQLVKAAEVEARKRGDTGMLVSTYTYQGPEFYKRIGFEIFGTVENYPEGFNCDCFVKRF